MAELIPISFDKLLKRIYYEYQKNDSIFDLPSRKFYRPNPELDLSVMFCGNRAANPVGPAAGPHTQLAQNIVLSWLAGARILELKTVQIKDELQLTRPCIDMATVGYNTEWSQELRLEDSLREYVKASMIIEILKESFGVSGFEFRENEKLTQPPNPKLETIFDISVGYDLAGIHSPQIRSWLQTMRDASELISDLRFQIPDEFGVFRDLPFKSEIGNSITLSTFHGCPANEIEKICEFLISEMDFHVIIKMNPPMLGKERLEHLLYEKLGYTDIEVHQKAYDTSIKFDEAVDMVRRLQSVAMRCNKTIGVKFGNTLEVVNKGNFLKDKIQYLSGQPLHILHLALVNEWRTVFSTEFPISFSAGVDANNFADIVSIGLVPVTTCTDLLRPGGYGRLPQYLYNLERKMLELEARTVAEFIQKSDMRYEICDMDNDKLTSHDSYPTSHISHLTSRVLEQSISNPRYHFSTNTKAPRKIGSQLHLWDCINCDKCIPVCPNDANFYFEIEPFEIVVKNIEIVNGSWRLIDGGVFSIKEKHQIGNFADACNECGNCDVFCPEDGGPYIEKPRFFSSLENWKKWNSQSGFHFEKSNGSIILYGRFAEKEFTLTQEGDTTKFQCGNICIVMDPITNSFLDIEIHESINKTIDMRYYFVMKTLIRGMMNKSRVHFVNVGLFETT
ncbi:MAG: 4Fe-4S dicluster domain-containing protein [Ignavibacteriae bacterium]|nr:4Fe-4S dicluster domain-containing protein [Ignavibacteriota bacterium]